MERLSKAEQIWTCDIENEHLHTAVEYAKKSLAWTFNRMDDRGLWSWYTRMMRIVVGVTAQETLIKKLKEQGSAIERDWTNYRTKDVFDLRTPEGVEIDIKCNNFFTDYAAAGRTPFSLDHIIENRRYCGDEWDKLVPALVPRDQIEKKDLYIFAILVSPEYRAKKTGSRQEHCILCSPVLEWGYFLNRSKIIEAREEASKGLDLVFQLEGQSTLSDVPLTLFIGFEKNGTFQEEPARLNLDDEFEIDGVSALSYVRIDASDFDLFTNKIQVSFTNNLDTPIYSGRKGIDLNAPPGKAWTVDRSMFADLYLPAPHELHFIGWLTKDDFKQLKDNYPSYAFPKKTKNQPSTNKEKGELLKRSCCYYYPNTHRGGLQTHNCYVPVGDLRIMDDLSTAF